MLFKCSFTVRIPLMAAALSAILAAGSASAGTDVLPWTPGLYEHPITPGGKPKHPPILWTHTTQEEIPDDPPPHMPFIPKAPPRPIGIADPPTLTLHSLPEALAAELQGASGVGGSFVRVPTSPVPGPSALSLLVLGALGLMGRRRT